MSIAMTPPLKKSLDKLVPTSAPAGRDYSDITSLLSSVLSQNNQDTLAVIKAIDRSLTILEEQKNYCSEAIAILEEAGGITVRARRFMTTPADTLKYRAQIKEFEPLFTTALKKLDTLVTNATSDGINLLSGNSLTTALDLNGQSSLTTQGVPLSSADLGIRPASFETAITLQTSRIDIMNAMDMAVTLRNIITSDSETLQVRKDVAVCFAELNQTAQTGLQNANAESEAKNLRHLSTQPLFADEPMAEPEQDDILRNFASSPRMEEKH